MGDVDPLLDCLASRVDLLGRCRTGHDDGLRKWVEEVGREGLRQVLYIDDRKFVNVVLEMMGSTRMSRFNEFVHSENLEAPVHVRGQILKSLPETSSFSVFSFEDMKDLYSRTGTPMSKATPEYSYRRTVVMSNRMECFSSFLSDADKEHFRASHQLVSEQLLVDVDEETGKVRGIVVCDDCFLKRFMESMSVLSLGRCFLEKNVKKGGLSCFDKTKWFDQLGWTSIGMILANRFELQVWQAYQSSQPTKSRVLDSRKNVWSHWNSLPMEKRVEIACRGGFHNKVSKLIRQEGKHFTSPDLGDLAYDVKDALRIIDRKATAKYRKFVSSIGLMMSLGSSSIHKRRSLYYQSDSSEHAIACALEQLAAEVWREKNIADLVARIPQNGTGMGDQATQKVVKRKKKKKHKKKHKKDSTDITSVVSSHTAYDLVDGAENCNDMSLGAYSTPLEDVHVRIDQVWDDTGKTDLSSTFDSDTLYSWSNPLLDQNQDDETSDFGTFLGQLNSHKSVETQTETIHEDKGTCTEEDFYSEQTQSDEEEWTTIGRGRYRRRPLSADGLNGIVSSSSKHNVSNAEKVGLLRGRIKTHQPGVAMSTHGHHSKSVRRSKKFLPFRQRSTPTYTSRTVTRSESSQSIHSLSSADACCCNCHQSPVPGSSASATSQASYVDAHVLSRLENKMDKMTSLMHVAMTKIQLDEEEQQEATIGPSSTHSSPKSTPAQPVHSYPRPSPARAPTGPSYFNPPLIGQQYAMYYNTNAAGVLFTHPYFGSSYPTGPQGHEQLPHEWHGREFVNIATTLNANEQAELTRIYRTRSAKSLSSSSLLVDGPRRLSREIRQFAEYCNKERQKRIPMELDVVDRLSAVVRNLWPRATVKRFGSCVTGLSLPNGDLDVVICLPKVMRNDIADEPGVLEGCNAMKMSWQQNIADALERAPFMESDSLQRISSASIPIIKQMTRGPPVYDMAIQLDISFETENHNGLATNKLVNSFCQKYPVLPPLLLVLKQFLNQRGLGTGYTGGLSSYGLLLLVVCFLRHSPHAFLVPTKTNRSRSNSHGPFGGRANRSNVLEDTELGQLLLRFFKFYGDTRLFNASTTGLSMSKGYFDRKSHIESERHWKSSSGDTVSLPGSQVSQHIVQRHQRARLDNAWLDSNNVDSHRFDPIFIDDPLLPGNNVGRNCFRIAAIQRAWMDAGDLLRRKMLEGHSEEALLSLIGIFY
mmetsp:Transcript_41509/g.66695  ORF Transcript_41509/g.66695 Transcript_41509/m.66695 type:complete len:1210 (-) Transcript_41509:407-4036(-)|eukprot:CAMPEP_0203745182 /NCGR_PEP_ID=MMETSP0098-20131031/1000_1 /ASSEMBLY_ACC=CAM_ASM_000208 /TAXON_ID=96639 /ORGANISM=" , Strain NY0313808BC1" /LENGTH=1209 /DNA_ID=CAMNT_0050632891 /DNA_START=566 /DNA_END=4195 /DNA_ORIENTATION=-